MERGNKQTQRRAPGHVVEDNLLNYKGEHFADDNAKFIDPATGAHFRYKEVFNLLLELREKRDFLIEERCRLNPLHEGNDNQILVLNTISHFEEGTANPVKSSGVGKFIYNTQDCKETRKNKDSGRNFFQQTETEYLNLNQITEKKSSIKVLCVKERRVQKSDLMEQQPKNYVSSPQLKKTQANLGHNKIIIKENMSTLTRRIKNEQANDPQIQILATEPALSS